ncbi:MFS transporter [Bacillus sp. X1(2014)]|uniref:MFS transporter n=1 Tax=Bacillus sp. X1(2014) TaxID=1565991 RepID=UPI0011A64FEB|nr:MFS transporter [Bacillus sp. X1(2014)]
MSFKLLINVKEGVGVQDLNIHSKKYENSVAFLFFLCWGFVFFDQSALALLFPLIVEEIPLNTAQIGQISMLQMIGFSISAPIFGILADRLGRKKLFLVLFALGTSLFCGLTTMANSFEYLLVIRTLLGICEGAVLPIMITILASVSSPHKFGRNVGIVYAGAAVIATTIGPIIATQLATMTTWRITFLIIALPTLIISFFIAKLVKEPINKVDVNTDNPVEKQKASIMELVKNRNVVLCLILGMFAFAGVWITLSYLPIYFTTGLKMPVERMGLIMTLSGAVTIFWQILVPASSDKIGRKPALIGFYALAIVSPLMLYLTQGSQFAIFLYVAIGGVCLSLTAIFNSVIPIESVKPELATTATSLIQGIGQLVGSLVVGFAGTFANVHGISVIMLLIAGVFAVCALLGFILIETNQRKIKINTQSPQPVVNDL